MDSTWLHSPNLTCTAILVFWCSPSQGHFPSIFSGPPSAQTCRLAQTRPCLGSSVSRGRNQVPQGEERSTSWRGHSQPGDPSLCPCPPVSQRLLRLSPGVCNVASLPRMQSRVEKSDGGPGRAKGDRHRNEQSAFLSKTFGNKTRFQLLPQLG